MSELKRRRMGLWQNTLTWYKNNDVEGQENKENKNLISFLSKVPHASFAIQQLEKGPLP